MGPWLWITALSRRKAGSAGMTRRSRRKPGMKMRSFDVCQCGAPLQAIDREETKPQGTEVLLKMLAAGVCHSDLNIWDGYYDIGGGNFLMIRRPPRYPLFPYTTLFR